MKLIGLPVFTDAGDRVGKVVDLELDENKQVRVYIVRRTGWPGFLKSKLIIHPLTVISIDKEKMVVKGTEIKIKEPVMVLKAT